MDLSTKTSDELVKLVQISEDKETLRNIADHIGVTYSGNSGINTMKSKILGEIVLYKNSDKKDISLIIENEDENTELEEKNKPDPVLMKALIKHQLKKTIPQHQNTITLPDNSSLVMMNERELGISEPLRRAIVRAKALRLIRCRVTNLDPQDSAIPAVLLTVYNKYTGKISKLIPFGEENENGYHIPKILIDELKSRTFNMRKEKKRIGSSFGVKEYVTVPMRKFSIEELPPLNQQDLNSLANEQKARGAIDQTV